ncbi:MAG: protein kinase, partial [Acidobacteriota bacterium]
GLGKAHREGVVHRDVKPANVFLTDDGQIKVLDFGIAKVIGDAALTRAGASVGTPYYMAPEQAVGISDPRSDLWALGVILFEMLTGERPFVGPNHSAIIQSAQNDPTPDVKAKRPDAPDVLVRAVERMLAKDPTERFQSADELVAALPVFAEPSGTVGLPADLVAQRQRKASLLPFLAGVLLTSLLASGLLYWMSHRPTAITQSTDAAGLASDSAGFTSIQSNAVQRTAVAVLPFTVRGGSDYDYLREGMVDLLSTKLDGAGDLRAVDSRALLRRMAERADTSADLARDADLARQLDADLLILGNVFEIAGQLRFDATLYRVPAAAGQSPEVIANASAEGQAIRIFSLVDDLAIQLLTGMDQGTASRMRQLAVMTSESFPALKAYLEGESAWRAGRFGDATRAFQAAVHADPGFALAWYRLSGTRNWLMDIEGYNEALQKAVEHGDRLTADDRRLLEVAIALKNGDAVAAERLCREVLSQRPDDLEAWSALGELEFHLGPVHGRSLVHARRSWERVLELEPNDRQAHLHLARIEGYAEEFEALDRRNRRLEQLLAGSERGSELRVFRSMLPGADADRTILRQALQGTELGAPWMLAGYALSTNLEYMEVWQSLYEELLSPEVSVRAQTFAHRHLGIFALSTGRLADGERHLDNATHPPEQPQEHLALAATLPFLPLAEEHVDKLIATVEGWTTEPTTDFSLFEPHSRFPAHHRLYILGLLVARAGDVERTAALADQLAAAGEISSFPGLARDLEQGLRAEMARLANQPEQVLELLTQRHGRFSFEMPMVSPLFGQTRERYLKAEALYQLERYEEALGWYESLSELAIFDLVYLGPAHLRRAEIHDKLGQASQAADQYRRFVKRWWDSDAALQPQIEQVRQRLGELSAGTRG